MSTIPSPVAELYEKSRDKGPIPPNECERLLTDIASDLRSVYLVFDGLDESGQRRLFLQSILNVARTDHVRLLVTSRPHIPDLEDLFQLHPNLMIEAHEEDLKTFIHEKLEQEEIYNIADQTFVNKLVRKLTKGAEGMYVLLYFFSNLPFVCSVLDTQNFLTHISCKSGFFSQFCDFAPFSRSQRRARWRTDSQIFPIVSTMHLQIPSPVFNDSPKAEADSEWTR